MGTENLDFLETQMLGYHVFDSTQHNLLLIDTKYILMV